MHAENEKKCNLQQAPKSDIERAGGSKRRWKKTFIKINNNVLNAAYLPRERGRWQDMMHICVLPKGYSELHEKGNQMTEYVWAIKYIRICGKIITIFSALSLCLL